MTQQLTTYDEIVEQYSALVRGEDLHRSVHGGQETLPAPSEVPDSRREAVWNDLANRYPDVIGSRSAPPVGPLEGALSRIDFDASPIVFGNGVPVGGHSHLTLYSDGTYAFTGHFHVSGAPSYTTTMVFVIADAHGRPISFAHQGRVHGTFESGSRNDDWAGTANNAMISQLWSAGLGSSWRWEAHVGIDVQAAIGSALQAAGYVAAVAAIFA